MKLNELIKALESMLPDKVSYGDLIGAEGLYAHSGPLVYEDPEPYFIEQAIEELKKLSKIQTILGSDYKIDQVQEILQKQSEYEDFIKRWKEAVEIAGAVKDVGAKRISELVKADQDGRCIVLPCKPSDVTVYQLRNKKHALGVGVHPRHIYCTTVWANGRYELEHQGYEPCMDKDFGKTWFLKEEEANAALEKMKEN